MALSMISNKASKQQYSLLFMSYAGFAAIAAMVCKVIGNGEFSTLLTLAALLKVWAFTLLAKQVLSTDSVVGISAKSLQLEAVALACRLSSTTWLSGYLPSDPSGDLLYPAFDVLSLGLVLWLSYQVCHHKTYRAGEDSLPAIPFVMGSLVLATLLHGDLDGYVLFDTLWMCGQFLGAVAVLPWLQMMTSGGAQMYFFTSHSIGVMSFAQILSTCYMWYAHPLIDCQPWLWNFNHSGYAVLAAHALHLLLLGTFPYLCLSKKLLVGKIE